MQPTGRRAEYAEQTRRAILEAARTLFTEQGYFATKVDQIAGAARVAPATVYAVGGGKSGLLRTLIESAVNSEENARIHAELAAVTDPESLLATVVGATRAKFEQWAPLMRQVAAAAPQEPTVRDSMKIAEASLRNGLRLTAERLAQLDALSDGIDVDRAQDLLWIYLSNTAYFVRTDDLGWSLDESQSWLTAALTRELLAR
ncbi:TetR/AcrR family transcriptional regulator [Actinoplanes couchii]|nr:TetR/AcrR family transcriptional regulator [Actinoplanes couchii]MDR6319902.1 AcrR family transcriptional regulator [Actinoplanes couchii]